MARDDDIEAVVGGCLPALVFWLVVAGLLCVLAANVAVLVRGE